MDFPLPCLCFSDPFQVSIPWLRAPPQAKPFTKEQAYILTCKGKGNVGEKKTYESFASFFWRDTCRHGKDSVYTHLQAAAISGPQIYGDYEILTARCMIPLQSFLSLPRGLCPQQAF